MKSRKTYSSFAELQAKLPDGSCFQQQLQHGDHVIFEHEGIVFGYEVHPVSLWEINGNHDIENDIFKRLSQTRLLPLGLDPFDFCEQHYSKAHPDWEDRKTNFPNLWPPYCCEDYESITKVVLELFRLIEEVPRQLAETSETLFID